MMNDPIYALVSITGSLLTLLTYAIIIRAVLSWFRPDPRNTIVRLISKITDPVLRPLERLIPPISGIDFTPLIAILLIQLVQSLLPSLIH
jgi:YggT family protein